MHYDACFEMVNFIAIEVVAFPSALKAAHSSPKLFIVKC